jgi:hypothetical protein
MQLRTARLCLDCEELHTGNECPVCASESFTFLTRWVPVSERRDRQRAAARPAPSEPSPVGTWMKRGAAGLALLAAGRWIWQATRSEPGADAAGGASRSERRPGSFPRSV